MICETVILADGTRAIICGGRRRRHRCACGVLSTKQCDFPKGSGTCDRHLCDGCAVSVGPDRDHCPTHQHATEPQWTLEDLF